MPVSASLSQFGWRRLVFSLVVLLTLGLFGLLGLILFQPGLIGGLLGHEAAAHAGQHFRSLHHRTHDLTFGFLFATAGVGMLAQLRAPWKNVAGQLMALIPWLALTLVFPLTNFWTARGTGFVLTATAIFGGLTLLAMILHPAGRNFFSSFSVSRVNRVTLALVLMAAVPLLAFASTNIGLQRTVTNDHAALGHYGFMAAFGLTVIGVGVLASLRPTGWRLAAWVAGFLTALLGLASIVFPDNDSSLRFGWALAAIGWGVVFVAAAEFTGEAASPTDVEPDRGPTISTPFWVYVSAIIFVVLTLLFAFMHLTGGGFGDHAPPAGGH